MGTPSTWKEDPELDRQIAFKVMGWERGDTKRGYQPYTLKIPGEPRKEQFISTWPWSSDPRWMMDVLAKMAELGWSYTIMSPNQFTEETMVQFIRQDYSASPGIGGIAYDSSLAKAICLAALKALEDWENHHA